MPHKGYKMQKKTIKLSFEEKIMHQDYLNDGGYVSRYAIWEYVENDLPIPNELKPILLGILQQDFKGKSKADTEAFWNIRVKEIILLINEKGVTQEEAIEEVATKHDLIFDTVERRYKQSKYRNLKNSLLVQNK